MFMHMDEEGLARADAFTTTIEQALDAMGIAHEQRWGFMFGWVYGQLRQSLDEPNARKMYDAALLKLEEQFRAMTTPTA